MQLTILNAQMQIRCVSNNNPTNERIVDVNSVIIFACLDIISSVCTITPISCGRSLRYNLDGFSDSLNSSPEFTPGVIRCISFIHAFAPFTSVSRRLHFLPAIILLMVSACCETRNELHHNKSYNELHEEILLRECMGRCSFAPHCFGLQSLRAFLVLKNT